MIARRAGRRYVERLSRAALDARRGPRAVVRADGSYIVTGGLGGLGMVVMRWLLDAARGGSSSTAAPILLMVSEANSPTLQTGSVRPKSSLCQAISPQRE